MQEEFGIPLRAGGADQQPAKLSREVLWLRNYARVREAVERFNTTPNPSDAGDLPESWFELCGQVEDRRMVLERREADRVAVRDGDG